MNNEYISESDEIIREYAKLGYNEGIEKAYKIGNLKCILYLEDIINKNPDITVEEVSKILKDRKKMLEKKNNK